MSIYRLKSIVRRSTMLGAAFAIAAAAFVPAASTFADALNPLTHRSLTLSSSAPGWDYTDGSGNATYAPPNSGANGKQTGNTFSFNVSTDSSGTGTNTPLQALTFQYCTTSAGNCLSPGNDGWTGSAGSMTRNGDSVSGKTSDLNVAAATATEVSSANYSTIMNTNGTVKAVPNRDGSQGEYVVLTSGDGGTTWTQVSGWTMKAENKEDGTVPAGTATGKNNYITIYNTSSTFQPKSTDAVKVIFFGTDANYITNPGSGAFFVKINDYSGTTGSGASTEADTTKLVDGGVTVANVMNESIEIQTKVLETMDFSVGTVDPDTLNDTQLAATPLGDSTHGLCNPIQQRMTTSDQVNVLQLGNTAAENSLSTAATYSTHSYWRLSSNSSAGATVYYSGVTLKNTVGDEIKAIGTTAAAPSRGTPQFGLALANGTIATNHTDGTGVYPVDYTKETDATKGVFENGADNAVTGGVDASVATDMTAQGLTSAYHSPQLYPLIPEANYDQGAGTVNGPSAAGLGTGYGTTDTKFAFDPNSNTIPTPLASESNQVVNCVTAKVRYIANIAATTPAGIYTTKINYIAAPQY